jgi:hypothetical protein
MSEALKNLFPALIALAGTALAVFVGYRQWKKQQDTARTSEFRLERQKTYKQLWEKLEDIHVQLRTQRVDTDEFRSLIRDVNSYILKQGLYLEAGDQRLANQYLSKVRDFTDHAATCNSAVVRNNAADTVIVSPDGSESIHELIKIQEEAMALREEILVRYRRVLTGEAVSPSQ